MEITIWIALVAIGMVALRIRWNYVTRRRLSDQQCQIFATEMCDELFDIARETGKYVKLDPRLAENFGRLETIEAIRGMNGRGFTTTNENWGWSQILAGELPSVR